MARHRDKDRRQTALIQGQSMGPQAQDQAFRAVAPDRPLKNPAHRNMERRPPQDNRA